MNNKTALLIVENNFNLTHVGVRRVIRFYWSQLINAGYTVTLASPSNGNFLTCSDVDAKNSMLPKKNDERDIEPTWKSNAPTYKPEHTNPTIHNPALNQVSWKLDKNISPDSFDLSIITAPWICADRGALREAKYSIGIVYDMVPNLLAIGALRMPRYVNAYEFAHQHSLGYDFYLRNVKKITCISESTKRDFLSFYGKRVEPRIAVSIPFQDFGDGRANEEISDSVLLINVLDHRKNFAAVSAVIKKTTSLKPVSLIIVGTERMPVTEVTTFLGEMSEICENVEWYRSPSDWQLEQLMKRCKVLFFPSIYEGLGPPILEAQAKGLPVISSNNSSCEEINLNPELTADPYDHDVFAEILTKVLDGTSSYLSGESLRSCQNSFLSKKNTIPLI